MPVVGSGFLSFQNFKKVLDTNRCIKSIELSNFGEILLNPELIEIAKYSHEKGIQLHAENGVNFNTASPELLAALVKYQFRSITCSIDGASEETYQQYRVKGSFKNVINNINELLKIKKNSASSYPILTWQFVIFGHNEKEIPVARAMAKEMGIGFRVKLNWDDTFSPINNSDFVKEATGLSLTSRTQFKKTKKRLYLANTCHQLWDQPQINWDGKLLGCCWNYWGVFGKNAFENSLYESLNDEPMEYAKKMLLGKCPARPDIPCTTCDNYKTMVSTEKFLNRGFIKRLTIKAKRLCKEVILLFRSSWK